MISTAARPRFVLPAISNGRHGMSGMTGPGFALETLLRETKPGPLREILGPSVTSLLEGLGFDEGRLGELAAAFIDPSEALRDPKMRDRIILTLPLQKARELADRLDAPAGREIYANLCKAASGKAALPLLHSFFGVVRDERAPEQAVSSMETASAKYGLFDHQRAAAAKVADALGTTPHKTVLHMPPGSGKTRTAMHILAKHPALGILMYIIPKTGTIRIATNSFFALYRQS